MTVSKASGRATIQSPSERTSATGRPSRRGKRKSPPAASPPPAAEESQSASPSSPTPAGKRPEAALPNVGVNLRLLREERGLTLQELSERSGVSKAMLNQIEAGRSSPTIALGWKIANGLGVPFGALLGEAMPGDFVVHPQSAIQTLYSADRRLCTRALFPSGDSRAAELYELTLEPGAEEQASSHTPGTREQIYVLSGQLTVETAENSGQLQAGDVLFFGADRPHRYFNPGRGVTRFVLVMIYPASRRR